MTPKRLPLSFPELEPKGRHAILRTADEIKAEQKSLEVNQEEAKASPRQEKQAIGNQQTNVRSNGRSTEYPNQQPNIQSNERTMVKTFERTKVRHSFDVYQDQLLSLTELQTEAFRATGHKPRISDMVQQALDAFLRSNKRKNVRTNERLNED